jgi:hypothetical protein
MSDSFSFPEKEQLCQENEGTAKAEFSETERASAYILKHTFCTRMCESEINITAAPQRFEKI